MVRKCGILHCENGGCFRDKKIKVYPFPKTNRKLQAEWIKRAGSKLTTRWNNAGVCEKHFRIDDYDYYNPTDGHQVFVHFEEEIKDKLLDKKLHYYAVPSVFPGIGNESADKHSIPANDVDDTDLYLLAYLEQNQDERLKKEMKKKEYNDKMKVKKLSELREELKVLQSIQLQSVSLPSACESNNLDLNLNRKGSEMFSTINHEYLSTMTLAQNNFDDLIKQGSPSTFKDMDSSLKNKTPDTPLTFDQLRSTLSISKKNNYI